MFIGVSLIVCADIEGGATVVAALGIGIIGTILVVILVIVAILFFLRRR